MTHNDEVERKAQTFVERMKFKLEEEALGVLDDLGDCDPKSTAVVLAYLITAAKNGFKAGVGLMDAWTQTESQDKEG